MTARRGAVVVAMELLWMGLGVAAAGLDRSQARPSSGHVPQPPVSWIACRRRRGTCGICMRG
jgi:hypothetical protein